jgi:hypothetical protein
MHLHATHATEEITMSFAVNLSGIPGQRHLIRQTGMSQRFTWRPRYRFGDGWHTMNRAQIAREMRMVSHRRAH